MVPQCHDVPIFLNNYTNFNDHVPLQPQIWVVRSCRSQRQAYGLVLYLQPAICAARALVSKSRDYNPTKMSARAEAGTNMQQLVFRRMTSCNYWKVMPQFVPLNGLHADICLMNRCSTSGAHLHFCSMKVCMGEKKMKLSVTSACIACTTVFIIR